MKVAVLGAGSWGTTLADLLARGGHDAHIWGNIGSDLAQMESDRENRKFLPGIKLHDGVKVQPELEATLEGAGVVVFAVPSQAVRGVAAQVAQARSTALPVSAAKGLELGTLKRMSEVLNESLGAYDPVVLTGPSHAEEVSRGIPTSVVAAARDQARAGAVQALCSSPATSTGPGPRRPAPDPGPRRPPTSECPGSLPRRGSDR